VIKIQKLDLFLTVFELPKFTIDNEIENNHHASMTMTRRSAWLCLPAAATARLLVLVVLLLLFTTSIFPVTAFTMVSPVKLKAMNSARIYNSSRSRCTGVKPGAAQPIKHDRYPAAAAATAAAPSSSTSSSYALSMAAAMPFSIGTSISNSPLKTVFKKALSFIVSTSLFLMREVHSMTRAQKVLMIVVFTCGFLAGRVKPFWKRYTSIVDIPREYFGPSAPVLTGRAVSGAP
jgi:hypothetical protein